MVATGVRPFSAAVLARERVRAAAPSEIELEVAAVDPVVVRVEDLAPEIRVLVEAEVRPAHVERTHPFARRHPP